jgi:DMSO reductase family type II enzyme heme b subunit
MTTRPWSRTALALLVLVSPACRARPAAKTPDVQVTQAGSLPANPEDPAWNAIPEFEGPLLLQDLVEPRLMKPSTSSIRVRALTDGARVAFRLEWADLTLDDAPRAGQFSDACAVQLPVTLAGDVPAPQMGEQGRGVEITFWRASWQAVVNGRPDTIQALYPNANPDHYPFDVPVLGAGTDARLEAERRYAPARALGNRMAGPRAKPVEDLLAQGPGTLLSGPDRDSAGRGKRTPQGWTVVLSRRWPDGLAPGTRSQTAFAVWEGSHEEAGARKMRTGWIPLHWKKGL